MKLIWATRGRAWGFRFLLDGGLRNPLASYESAFVRAENVTRLCRRSGTTVALRFPDPLGRTDSAGRVIPHDFVVLGSTGAAISSVEDGLREIWPFVANVYASVWDDKTPPTVDTIRSKMAGDST